jgi:hypothetical protein
MDWRFLWVVVQEDYSRSRLAVGVGYCQSAQKQRVLPSLALGDLRSAQRVAGAVQQMG